MNSLSKVILVVLLVSQVAFAQTASFNSKLNQLSQNLEKVVNGKSTFDLSMVSSIPGVATFTEAETTSKGKVNEAVYEFNFADIDVNTVRYETSKDLIKVQLIAKQNQRMIKLTKNKEKVSYIKELFILAKDIDNAREIVKIVKELVPISNKITENRLSLRGYEDRLNWLTKNIFAVESIDKKVDQVLTKDNSYPASVELTSTVSKSKSVVKKSYKFNLSNINDKEIFFKNKGSDFIITVATKRNLKAIKVIKNGEDIAYVTKFDIICKSVENARELQKVLQDIVPLADKRFKTSLPKASSVARGVSIINEKIASVISEKLTVTQKLEGDCILSVSQVKEATKKKNSYKYQLNLIDINKQDIAIAVRGKMVYVIANTIANNKFIKQTKNDEQQNYASKLELVFNSVEDAIVYKEVLKEIVGLCSKNKRLVSKSIASLESELKKISLGKLAYEQKIETLSDGDVKFTSTKVSDKSSEENIQEFKLKDMNPKSVVMKVSGKKVMVEVATNYQEKIIKTYKNGAIKNYTNKVLIYCDSIENARLISETLKGITGKK